MEDFIITINLKPKQERFKYLLHGVLSRLESECETFTYNINPEIPELCSKNMDSFISFNGQLQNFRDVLERLTELEEDLSKLDTWDKNKREKLRLLLSHLIEMLNTSVGAIYSQGYKDGCDWEKLHLS